VRFKAPGREGGSMPPEPDFSKLRVPMLIIAGEQDNLRDPGYGEALRNKIPGASLLVVNAVILFK
jgi:pimeloyl-ACP methyl ester carboxylesterase